VLAIIGGAGLWQAARLLRDPRQASAMLRRQAMPVRESTRRGMVRGALPLGFGLVFIAIGLLVAAIAKPMPHHPTAGAVTAVILIAVGLLGLACHFSIMWFDWPAWLIPPHLRSAGQAKSRTRR
jgi:hypothetical protein